MRDPDPVASPVRRIGGALFASIMVAVVAVAAVGVYGVLRPAAGDGWKAGDALVTEKETGARFVYRAGVLHPVLNYASALLVLGSAAPSKAEVPASSLVGVPRGGPVGIWGAPDLLPAPGQLATDPWSLCSRPGSAGRPAESVLVVGERVAGTVTRFDQAGLMVSDPGGQLHLLWNNHRYRVADAELVLTAFAWPRQSIVAVSAALLNALPAGAELGHVTVAAAGRDSVVPGLRVGQVYVVTNTNGDRTYGVAQAQGLAEITAVQADLLLTEGANGQALGGQAITLGQAQYAAAPKATSLVPTGAGAPPATTPQPVAATGPVVTPCANFAGPTPELSLVSPAPATSATQRTSRAAGDPVALADWIVVPPGRGALVQAVTGPDAPTGALALVTDAGLRFPLPSDAVVTTLGYAGVAPVRLPAALVALLPAGPALDPAAAAIVGGSYPQAGGRG